MTGEGDRGDRDPSVRIDTELRAMARAERLPPPVSEDLTGRTIAHYVIEAPLGAGGMGVVYRARDSRLGREVALKVLPPAFAAEPERRARLVREARTAAAINHVNIATVHDVGESDGRLYLAMELVDGTTLRQRLDGGAMAAPEALRVARQIAGGLARAHAKGVIHRDLKPENVMLARDGTAKILDFGLAKLRESPSTDSQLGHQDTQTLEGRVMGTPGYMSPEQAAGRPVDERTDVYALGVMLHEMLTGGLPGVGSGRKPIPDRKLDAVIERCTMGPPELRWPDAGAVLAALDQLPQASPARGRRLVTGGKWLVGGTVLLVGAVGLVAAYRRPLHRESTSWPAASSVPAPSATTPRKVLRLVDLPPPRTNSAEARQKYLEGLRNEYDARASANDSLVSAIQADPNCAACYLRGALRSAGYSGVIPFEHALALRDQLDERDLRILDAVRPDKEGHPEETQRALRELNARFPEDQEVAVLAARWLPPADRIAALQRIVGDDPGFAGGELLLARELAAAGRVDEAKEHYGRCVEKSPHAAECILGLGELESADGRCEILLDAVRRVYVFDRESMSTVNALLDTTLTSDGRQDEAQILVDTFMTIPTMRALPGDSAAIVGAQVRGDVALWFGDFAAADAQYDVMRRRYPDLVFPQDVDIAEETGDPTHVRAIARKAHATRADYQDPQTAVVEGHLLRLMRQQRIVVPGGLEALTMQRKADCERSGAPPADCWLAYDAAPAVTADEAKAALASEGEAFVARPLAVWRSSEYGRLLLLANRPGEAVDRLASAAHACRLTNYTWIDTDAAVVHRASLWLGEAYEALGDKPSACAAYARGVGAWAEARPRSVTAEGARGAMKRLRCSTP